MSKSFWWRSVGQAVSLFGDWAFCVGTFWILIAGLRLESWHGNLQLLLGAAAALAAGVMRARFPANWSARTIIIIGATYATLKSALVAWLVYSQEITFGWLVAMGMISSVMNLLVNPSAAHFDRALIGENQYFAAAVVDLLSWVSRISMGVVLAFAILRLDWTVFALDAVTFLPLIVIVAFVKLPYRNEDHERIGTCATIWEGVRYTRNDGRTFVLLMIHGVQNCTCSIIFSLAVETIIRNLKGGAADYGWMLTISGFAGLAGSAIGFPTSAAGPRTKMWVFLSAALLIPASVLLAGLSDTLILFSGGYGAFCLFVGPRSILTEAELRHVPGEHLGAVFRLKALIEGTFQPLFWFIISFTGAWIGLTAKEIVVASAAVGLVLTAAVLAYAAKKGILGSLFVPR